MLKAHSTLGGCADGVLLLLQCRAFLHAVLCGYSTPDGRVKLNPLETDVPPAGSRLILLGRGGQLGVVSSCLLSLPEPVALHAIAVADRCTNLWLQVERCGVSTPVTAVNVLLDVMCVQVPHT